MKDERERIGRDIFIYSGEALLNNMTEYSLHFLSFAEQLLHPVGLFHIHWQHGSTFGSI